MEGVSLCFEEEFQRRMAVDDFLEWAVVHGEKLLWNLER